jgi:putative membrane protein
MVPAVDVTLVNFFTKASAAPVPLIFVAAGLGWYFWSVRRLTATGRQWHPAHTVFFCLAALTVLVATVSGLGSFARTSFAVNSIQHFLVGLVAPVFLALSAPITLALRSTSRPTQTAVLNALHGRAGRALSNPLITWPVYGVSVFVLYFSGLYAASLHHDALYDFILLYVLVIGCLLVWPAVAIDPLAHRLNYGQRIIYLLLFLPFHTILGMSIESQSSTIAAGMTVSDFHMGGGLLWVAGEIVGLLGVIAVFVQWLMADERSAKRYELTNEGAAARQVAHWRETREAAARAASD